MFEYIISFIAPLAYFLFLTATLVQITKRSFGKCLPIGMMLSAFLLFFSQLIFNTFWAGFIIGILFAVAVIPLLIIKRKKWAEFKKLYFTPGMVTFLVIYILIYIFDLCRGFTVWDELMHWGPMVKEMTRLDQFYSVDASNLMVHKDYPPIMQLFELFWTKLCGGFNEAYIERALHTFELSLLLPFIAEKVLAKRDFWQSVLAGVAGVFSVIMIIAFFDVSGTMASVYVDYVMALLVVYLLMTILVNKKITWFEIVTIAVGGSFLLLLKQMGLPLYLMVLVFLIGILWLRKKCRVKEFLKNINYKKIILYIVLLIIPFVLWFIWGKIIEGNAQQFELSDLNVKDFIKILLGQGEPWQSATVGKYVTALAQTNISTSFIKMSYMQSIILFVGFMWLNYKVFKLKKEKKEIILLVVITIIGSIGYAVAMLMLYVLSFGELEGPKLASYDRYMGTFSILMITMTAFVALWYATTSRKYSLIYISIIVLCMIVTPDAYSKISPVVRPKNIYDSYRVDADKVSNLIPEDSNVYLLAQETGWSGWPNFLMQYYGTPIKYSWREWDSGWPTDNSVNAKDYYEKTALPEVMKNDYMLVIEATDEFTNKYCSQLKICPIKEGDLYKIVLDDNKEFVKYELITNIKE